jgi:uncharacterized protein (TIGR04255 family)
MSKTYKKPPIKEAVCEVRFLTGNPLTPKGIESFCTAIEGYFPNRSMGKIGQFQLSLSKEKKGETKMTEQEFNILLSEDKKTAVHIFPEGVLSIHKFEPYSSWSDFKPLIFHVISTYVKVFGPDLVERVGLRYVNEIKFNESDFSTKKYFLYELKFPEEVEGDIVSHFVGTLFKLESGRDLMNVQIADTSTTQQSKDKVFMFDLDYFLSRPQSILVNGLNEWIENAHIKLENYFEAILSDETKKMFE